MIDALKRDIEEMIKLSGKEGYLNGRLVGTKPEKILDSIYKKQKDIEEKLTYLKNKWGIR